MIEPIKGNLPVKATDLSNKNETERNEKMIEPIRENAPVKDHIVGDRSTNQEEMSIVEPIKPVKGQEKGAESEVEKNEGMIERSAADINKALYNTVYSQAVEESHKESVEGLSSVKPVFEKIPPQMHIKEDYEVQQTEPAA
jgi:hypothetical protein